MTTPQGQVPPPPEGYPTWLDYALDPNRIARAELFALRERLADTELHRSELLKELSTTKGLLATARENLMEMDAQRAEAVREVEDAEEVMHEACSERDKAKALLVRCVNDGTDGGADEDVSLEFLAHAPAECAAIKQQRDALRAQVAEMREAILGLGEGKESHASWIGENDVDRRFTVEQWRQWRQWCARVAQLRAEPKEEKQP